MGNKKNRPFERSSQTIKKGENRDLRTILKFAEYYVCVWRTYDVRKNRGCETRSQPRKFNNKIQYGKNIIQIPTFQLRMYPTPNPTPSKSGSNICRPKQMRKSDFG